MKYNNTEKLENKILKKYQKKDKRRPKMKVSGKSVLTLKKIMDRK